MQENRFKDFYSLFKDVLSVEDLSLNPRGAKDLLKKTEVSGINDNTMFEIQANIEEQLFVGYLSDQYGSRVSDENYGDFLTPEIFEEYILYQDSLKQKGEVEASNKNKEILDERATRWSSLRAKLQRAEEEVNSETTGFFNENEQHAPYADSKEREKLETQEELMETNKFCKAMPLSIAIEHFLVFPNQNSINQKPFLTTEEFNAFIQRAFYGNSLIPKQKLNQTNREKWFLVKRFYEFYNMAVTAEYENSAQCREKYIKLLTDNFIDWSYPDIVKNFNKKVKRTW